MNDYYLALTAFFLLLLFLTLLAILLKSSPPITLKENFEIYKKAETRNDKFVVIFLIILAAFTRPAIGPILIAIGAAGFHCISNVWGQDSELFNFAYKVWDDIITRILGR